MNSLNTFTIGDENYIAKMNQDNTTIKQAIDALEALVGGATNLQAAAVPKGLQYIFDRQGIIGKGSYKPVAGSLSGPNYNLTVAAGGFYDGANLVYQDAAYTIPLLAVTTGTHYLSIDTAGTPSVVSVGGARTPWQFYYNASTHQVSDVVLYAGTEILFAGADYADALTSARLGLTFQSLADRLEEIEARLVEMGTYYQYDPDTTSGLDFGYLAGKVRNDNVIWDTNAGTVTLTGSATNYVEVNPADGSVSANTSGFTAGSIPLYVVITSAGAITDVTDRRTWVAAGTGGEGGGGHTQNTDTGTTANAFKLNMDEAGTPSQDCRFEVERGTSPNTSIKWNEASNKWQFTNDGVSFQDIFDAAGAIGAQEFTKYVGFDDPPKVLEDLARGSSLAYESLDLNSYSSAVIGVQGVIVRVFFWDSTPGAMVNVLLRAKGSAGAPAESFTVWSNENGPSTLVIPTPNDLGLEYYVQASGEGTANVKIYLAGYFEKVTGVGTIDKITTHTGISVAAAGNTLTNIAGCCNRGLAHYLKVTETGGLMTGVYDIEFYVDDACTTLLYRAVNITPSSAFEDFDPFWLRDADGTKELHVKVINKDSSQAGTFTIEIHYEQFA